MKKINYINSVDPTILSEEEGAKRIALSFMFRDNNDVVQSRLNNPETTVLLYSDFMDEDTKPEAFICNFEGHSIALIMSTEEFAWTVLEE